MKQKLLIALTLILLSFSYFLIPSKPAYAQNSVYFAQTGHSVSGAFKRYLDAHGGIDIFGLPISDELTENGFLVQYFERERLEFHPENANTPYECLLGLLSVQLNQGRYFAPATEADRASGALYFASTNHTLAQPFRNFWENRGGIFIYGYPISQPLWENGFLVQYFERARFEDHPEHLGTGYEIQLGLLGVQYVRQHGISTSSNNQNNNNANNNGLAHNETDMLADVNAKRAAIGIGSVSLDNALNDIAKNRSKDMASRNYFSHYTPEGTTFIDTLNAQNIAYSFAGETIARNNYSEDQTTNVAWNAFMNSPAHKTIILDNRFNKVGVGYATSTDGMHYFTLIFTQP